MIRVKKGETIGRMHLSIRLDSVVRQYGIETVRDFVELDESRLQLMRGIGVALLAEAHSRMETLLKSISDGRIDWLKYYELSSVELLPRIGDRDFSRAELAKQIPELIGEMVTRRYDETCWRIISERFGFENHAGKTIAAISRELSIHWQNVETRIQQAARRLYDMIVREIYGDCDFRLHPRIQKIVMEMYSTATDKETELKARGMRVKDRQALSRLFDKMSIVKGVARGVGVGVGD